MTSRAANRKTSAPAILGVGYWLQVLNVDAEFRGAATSRNVIKFEARRDRPYGLLVDPAMCRHLGLAVEMEVAVASSRTASRSRPAVAAVRKHLNEAHESHHRIFRLPHWLLPSLVFAVGGRSLGRGSGQISDSASDSKPPYPQAVSLPPEIAPIDNSSATAKQRTAARRKNRRCVNQEGLAGAGVDMRGERPRRSNGYGAKFPADVRKSPGRRTAPEGAVVGFASADKPWAKRSAATRTTFRP